jgi:hypothetical protein
MTYSLQQAAEATGKSKSTIQRAIKSGKISAGEDVHGNYQIDPAELHRVYPPKPLRNDAESDERDDTQQDNSLVETTVLRVELQQMRELLNASNLERERERQQAADVIDDLRRRLDAEAEARRIEGEERRKLTAILTDQRTQQQPEPAPAAARKGLRGWLHRITA